MLYVKMIYVKMICKMLMKEKKQMIDNNNTICEKGTYQFETN